MIRAAILTAAVCLSPTVAQDEPPKLELVFSDDFLTDTRGDYKVSGDVSWESGQLTLAEGASIERAINGGTWARVELLLQPLRLTTEQPHSEVRVWFLLDGATNCYVGLRRELKGGQITGSVALVDTGEKDGTPTEQVVREVALRGRDHARLSVDYRNGLVAVTADNEAGLVAYIDNGSATVTATRLTATAVSPLKLLGAAALRDVPRDLNAQEQQQLADARDASRESYRLSRDGKFAEAAKIAEKVVDIQKSVLGEQHSDFATSLNNLTAMYEQMGKYARAERLYRQASDIWKSVLGEQHPSYATSLNNLASLYARKGDYARAEPLHKQTIEIDKSVLGEQHPYYASSLDNLAGLYVSMGDYARAEPLCRQATDIRKSVLGEQHPHYAASLHNLAQLYRSMGDYARAEPLYRQAIEIAKSVLGEQHPRYAISLNNLAGLYKRTGDYARAEPLCRQAIEIQKSVLGEQHPDYAISLSNLASVYESMGDYAQAELLYRQTIEIEKSVLGEQHPSYATSLNSLGLLYARVGDYARAEPLYARALEIQESVLGEQHPHYATSLNNLGLLCEFTGDYARAEPLYTQASGIWEQVLGEQHPHYAISLNNLGLLYANMGDYARAEPLYKQAADIRKLVLGGQHPDYAQSLDNLAVLYEFMADDGRAEGLYTQAMGILRKNLDDNSLVQSERQQKRNQTVKRFVLDSRLTLARRSSVKTDELLEAYWQWKGAVTLRQQAYRRVAANPTLRRLFEKLRSISGQLSAHSNRAPVPPPASAPEAVREAWGVKRKDWEARLAALTRTREDLEQEVASASNVFRRVREPLTVAAVRKVLPSATAFVDVLEYDHATPDPEEKGKRNHERRYIAFVVRADRPPEIVGLGNAKSLSGAIAAFRRPLAGEAENLQAATQAAATLREELWLPLEKHLDGIDTVVISPDTALGTLPLGALPGKEPGSYLIEQYKFASMPLASMLRSLNDESRHAPERGLLVIGDVAYEGKSGPAAGRPPSNSRPSWRQSPTRGGKWDPLRAARAELAEVRVTFEKSFRDATVTTLDDASATEEAFMEQAPRHHNLHLVTHGYFAKPEFEAIGSGGADGDGFDPLRRTRLGRDPTVNQYLPGLLSGIVLAGANNPPPDDNPNADGILTASEIETLDLNAVDLVVLSACDTGLGKTAGGEGLTGLQRAFHIAGARSVVASLWEVDDKATQELMSRFYRYYWEEGRSKINSLRQAQLDLLNDRSLTRGVGGTTGDPRERQKAAVDADNGGRQRTDPRYWAAFVLSGDWR